MFNFKKSTVLSFIAEFAIIYSIYSIPRTLIKIAAKQHNDEMIRKAMKETKETGTLVDPKYLIPGI